MFHKDCEIFPVEGGGVFEDFLLEFHIGIVNFDSATLLIVNVNFVETQISHSIRHT